MYCTLSDFQSILPPSVSLGDQNLGTPSPGSSTSKRDKITTAQAIQYIRYASQQIDSRLRPYYECPLRRVKTFETEIVSNISAGSSVMVPIYDSSVFAIGNTVRVQDRSNMELTTISAIANVGSVVVSTLVNGYSSDGGKLSIVTFPDPIPILAARLACSYGFDILFTSDQAPDISNYGKEQKRLAAMDMDGILSGTILLFGQEHTGMRFCRGSLYDSYANPTKDLQYGREKP